MSRPAQPLITGLVPERVAGDLPDLSRHEQIVLQVVWKFFDRDDINERIEGERQMTQAEWAAARQSLIRKRLLSEGGALTHRGREAVGGRS
jgi:hypothetical protein